MRILVTGASGFIASTLCPRLVQSGHHVLATSRIWREGRGFDIIPAPDFRMEIDWASKLGGINAVVHLAGRAKVDASYRTSSEIEAEYERINSKATRILASQLARSEVKHLIFLSSTHAVAAESDRVLTDRTVPQPVTAYGRSKLAAEGAIKSVLADSDCAWTILRPPLVYGPGNKANFGLLVKWVKARTPLPLASVRNRRSFIYVENLVDLIVTCLGNPKAFGKTFLPSDGKDVSTPELIRAIARASISVEEDGKWKIGDGSSTRHRLLATRYFPRLFPFPESVLKALGQLPGLGALRKLTSSLYVDSEPIRRDLGWKPPFTMEEGLRRTLAG